MSSIQIISKDNLGSGFEFDNINSKIKVSPSTNIDNALKLGNDNLLYVSNKQSIVVKASIPLSGHIAIALDSNGEAIRADNTISSHGLSTVGISRNSAIANDYIEIAVNGIIEHSGWSFIPNQPVFLGQLGTLTQNATSGLFQKVLGIAQTPTKIIINMQSAIYFN